MIELVDAEKNLTQINVRVPTEQLGDALEWIEKSGYHKWKAVLAAIRLLRWIPSDVREMLMRGDEQAARDWFQSAEIQNLRKRLRSRMAEHEESLQSQEQPPRAMRRKAGGGTDR